MRTLTMCNHDIARYTIVLSSPPAPAETTAAEFLQRVISTACGLTLPISDTGEYAIRIGTREPSPAVKWDGFRITSDEKNVYLDGNIPRGTLYAAYDFAEKYLGYRRFAADCEVIPTEGEVSVPANLDFIDNPTFEERRSDWCDFTKHLDFGSACRINNIGNDEFGGAARPGVGCHTFGHLLPGEIYFEEHPEYYALVDGKRIPCYRNSDGPGELCLTNPDVLRLVTENVLKQLRENPNLSVVDVSQCDNINYCRCEKCAAVDAEEGSQSGTIIRFVNAVAEAVEKEFPHVMVQTFAYTYSTKPPKKTRARHNVIIRYCTMDACFRHALDDPNCPHNQKTTYSEMVEWQKMCDHMCIWDYVTNWKCFLAPFPNLQSLRKNARFFSECHTLHIFEEDNPWCNEGGVFSDLKAYLIGKVLWNAYISEEEYEQHINEFLAAFYGKGWQAIRKYLDLEYEVTADRCFTCNEKIDGGSLNFFSDPEVKWLKRYLHDNFDPGPYLPMLPNHPLTGLVERMNEVQGYFDTAMEQAETEEERLHIKRSRMGVDYIDLFCSDNDRFKMTAEENKVYVARVDQFREDKTNYGFYWNLQTWKERNR